MTGPEHYREAEHCATQGAASDGRGELEIAKIWLSLGLLHAVLALAEAYVAGAVMRPGDRDAWDLATSRLDQVAAPAAEAHEETR